MTTLAEIEDRVHGYFTGAPVRENEPDKHQLVRRICEVAQDHGITEDELRRWAHVNGEPSVGVMNAQKLVEVTHRWNRVGGVVRWRMRLSRDEAIRKKKR